jgi:hypothetical protein
LELTESDADDQDAVEIAPIRSSAKLKVDVLANPNAARDIELRDHDSGYGRFAGERRTRPNVVQQEGITITTSNRMDRSGHVVEADETEGRHVGNVRHSSSAKRNVEGMTIEDTSSRRSTKSAPAPKAAAKAAPVPKPHIPDDASPKLKVAIRLCPKFPVDWNFFAKSEDKVARIKKLGASPDLLDALYSVESPAMRKVLETKYKSHFA